MPMDLLHLARTSRAFHGLLMTRSATGLWRAARKNVDGLPDCPTHLSEPAYAKLAFDSHCHVRKSVGDAPLCSGDLDHL